MTIHRYPPQAGAADLIRAGLGATLAATPLLFLSLAGWLTGLLVLLFALFVSYAAVGVGRLLARIETDQDGVRLSGPWRQRTIAWERLRRLRLTYHSTRANREQGWMTLSLTGDDRIEFDSRIDGFAEIVRRAAAVAARRHLPVDAATQCNLRALGLCVPDSR